MPSPVAFSATGSGGKAAAAGDRPKLVHAHLQPFEPNPSGDLSKPGAQLPIIEFQFNPKELTLAKSAQWARETGKGNRKSGPPQYQGPQPSKLTLEMFFDASEKQDDSVLKRVEQLFACCVPTATSHDQKKGSPPWVLFRWGGLTGFLAYISSVSAKYTVFTTSGLPVRAVCTVTLEELAGETPRQNPTSGGPVPRRVHTLVDGDTLPAIAFREYGNASMWRAVARANGIDDPLRLPVGSTVLLPTPEDLEGGHAMPAPVEEMTDPGVRVAPANGARHTAGVTHAR
jgi:hypothetical protein